MRRRARVSGGSPLDLRERLPEGLGGLDVGVGAGRLLREPAQGLDRLLGLLGPVPMMRQPVEDLLEAPLIEGLQRAGRGGVKGLAPGGEQALVGHLLDERVLEGVAGLVPRRRRLQELVALELQEMHVEVVTVPEEREQRGGELAPQHGADLQQTPRLVVQPVDPGHEHALDRLRHDRVLRPVAPVDGPGELLEEEGVAVAAPHDELGLDPRPRTGAAPARARGCRPSASRGNESWVV